MRIRGAINKFEGFVWRVNYIFHRLGLGILFVLMFLTVGDVFGRYFLSMPIPGTFELTEFMTALIVFFSIGYTQVRKGHISIDVLVSRFSGRAQAVVDSITYLISLGLFSLITWQSAVHAHRLYEGHNLSGVLSLPVYPFVIVLAIGCLLFCTVLVINLLHSLIKAIHYES